MHDHFAGLETVLARSHGGWADEDSLLEFRRLCSEALLVAGECRDQIELLLRYAKDLYSDCGHHRWDIGPLLGADILRRKIRMTLSACRARVNGLELPTARVRGSRYARPRPALQA